MDGSLDELGLATIAVSRDDHSSGDAVGNLCAVVAPDEVQAEIDACGGTCRREDLPIIDVQRPIVDADVRKPLPED